MKKNIFEFEPEEVPSSYPLYGSRVLPGYKINEYLVSNHLLTGSWVFSTPSSSQTITISIESPYFIRGDKNRLETWNTCFEVCIANIIPPSNIDIFWVSNHFYQLDLIDWRMLN